MSERLQAKVENFKREIFDSCLQYSSVDKEKVRIAFGLFEQKISEIYPLEGPPSEPYMPSPSHTDTDQLVCPKCHFKGSKKKFTK